MCLKRLKKAAPRLNTTFRKRVFSEASLWKCPEWHAKGCNDCCLSLLGKAFLTGQIAGINPEDLDLKGPNIHFVSLGWLR